MPTSKIDMKIPLFKIYWDESDINSVTDAIKAGMNWAIGPNIERFESLIAKYIGTKYALVFNSGTSALHAALQAHGIKRGDEIIAPSFTFIATANAALYVGARPIFADIEEQTFGLDPEDVREKINERTKAIIPIHYGGCPCNIKELREIADENNLILVEDAAEALGARIDKKNVGTFGNSAVLSFCANKIITTGEGGAVVTDDKALYEKLKLVRSHGRLDKGNYFYTGSGIDYVELGYNFRMSNITAALGISQIKKANKIIKMRRKNAFYMAKRLSKLGWIKIQAAPGNYFHVYQMLTILAENRDSLMKHLAKDGIFSKVFFDPVHKTKFYREKYRIKLPVTENISQRALSLPIYPHMTKEEMDSIINSVASFGD